MIHNELFAIAFIADIHFGALKTEKLYEQLKERFLRVIDGKRLDMIVFGGDLFHTITSMNYSTAHSVMMFMEEVVDICIQNDIKYIRLIQGTASHDNRQLHNFSMYENRSDINFRIIMSIEEEHLAEGLDILYVPEEYMNDMEQFYAPYLSQKDKYDFIFGHGMFKEVGTMAKQQLGEITMSRAPVFDSKQMINACKGPIFFGHIHTNTVIRKHVYYPGSFSRFQHGEETDKGFYLCVYNVVNHKYAVEFIHNDMAEEYITIKIPDFTVYKDKPEDIVDVIESIQADYKRVKIVLVGHIDFSYALQFIREYAKDKPRLQIQITDEAQFVKEQETERVVNTLLEKYAFIFDSGISHEEKIQKFIKIRHGKELPIETIKNELNLL
jgi:hypothetical protein